MTQVDLSPADLAASDALFIELDQRNAARNVV